jgi:hypothetical protein
MSRLLDEALADPEVDELARTMARSRGIEPTRSATAAD